MSESSTPPSPAPGAHATGSAIRVRFAPSPTGYLHIGGARTALWNWLFARHNGGTFVLRIEDTDTARSTPEMTNAILDSMRWLGLDWDEGPFFQSERTPIYREHAERLLASGHAYRCYCTAEELTARREAAEKENRNQGYDGTCRTRTDAPAGRPFAVRFRQASEGSITVHDLVMGDVTKTNAELDDLIILRSDGTATYNFSVVIDDGLMRMTHVIRGSDHLNNTFRQLGLFRALGFPLPAFGHVPMILGHDKQKLSKRHGAVSVTQYRDDGFLPEALVNFLVRIGWSHGDEELFTREDLIQKFSLDHVGRSAGVFNAEKLAWVNQHWMRAGDPRRIGALLAPHLRNRGVEVSDDDARLPEVVRHLAERSHTLVELAAKAEVYWKRPTSYDAKAIEKVWKPDAVAAVRGVRDGLAALETFDAASIQRVFEEGVARSGLALGKLAQPVRLALTGGTVSAGIYEVAAVLGRDETVARLDLAFASISA